jgi:tyrosinase
MIRYRKNIACLTSDQLHDLREALAILYALPTGSTNSWQHIGGLHGQPAPAWCIHGAPGFLTWHRAYLLVLEEALRQLDPSITLPYWNWSSGPTTGVPDPCESPTYVDRNGDSVPNPLYAGPLPGGAMTDRAANIDSRSFDDLATSAQNALTNSNFAGFQSALNGAHGGVHVRVGGDMSSVPFAGFDPIFYLHHANVDRLWALWQSSHPAPLPPDEASLTLDPFLQPCSTDLYTGSDMESTTALGYGYLHYCLIVIGPILVLEPIPLDLPPWGPERLERAKLVLRASRMAPTSTEVRVFINQPDADESTRTIGNPHFAGVLGLFGMSSGRGDAGRDQSPEADPPGLERGPMVAMRGERFDVQVDITDALGRALASKEQPTLSLVPVDSEGRLAPGAVRELGRLELLVR